MAKNTEAESAVKSGRSKPYAEPVKVTVKPVAEAPKAEPDVVKAVDPAQKGGKAKTSEEKSRAAVQAINPGTPDTLRVGGVAAKHNTRV